MIPVILLTVVMIGILLVFMQGWVIPGVVLVIVGLYGAYRVDVSRMHPHLGMADEQSLYDDGAVPTECPVCDDTVPIRDDKEFPNPNGGTICANCGSSIASDGDNIAVINRNKE